MNYSKIILSPREPEHTVLLRAALKSCLRDDDDCRVCCTFFSQKNRNIFVVSLVELITKGYHLVSFRDKILRYKLSSIATRDFKRVLDVEVLILVSLHPRVSKEVPINVALNFVVFVDFKCIMVDLLGIWPLISQLNFQKRI